MADIDLLLWYKTKTGDEASFELLFHRYYTVLCLFAKRYTRDMVIAREVVQDLLAHLWENREEISIHSSVKAYLYRAVSFNSIRRMKNERKHGIRFDFPPEPENAEFNDHLEYAELQDSILQAIESLPEQCRKIFKMSRFECLKYAEIAERLNLSVKTIEIQISKALRVLQQKIDGMLFLLAIFLINNSL